MEYRLNEFRVMFSLILPRRLYNDEFNTFRLIINRKKNSPSKTCSLPKTITIKKP